MNKIIEEVTTLKTPEYGYQNHLVEGIGFLMVQGTKVAISLLQGEQDAQERYLDYIARKIEGMALLILSLPLTIPGLILKKVGGRFPVQVEPLVDTQIASTNSRKIEQLYNLLRYVDTICREENISYFIEGGTLLGAVRHGGIIPWDDDADLGIMEEDLDRLLCALNEKATEIGVEIDTHHATLQGVYKLRFTRATLENEYSITNSAERAEIDIMPFREIEERRSYCTPFSRNQHPHMYFTQEELNNLTDYSFGPRGALQLRGIADPEAYLQRCYGPDYLEYAVQTHTHAQVGHLNLPIPILRKTKYRISEETSCAQGSSSQWQGDPVWPLREQVV